MKKLLTLSVALLLIAGCAAQGNYSTKVENGSEVAVNGSNVNITNQDIYEYLMDNYGADYVVNKALQLIADNYPIDEETFKKELDTTVNTYKSFMGEDLDKFAKENLGYDTFDAYVEEVMKPSIRQKMMVNDYVDTNYETLAKQYHFKKIRMITLNDETAAMNLISKISSGEITFEQAVKEFSTDKDTKDKNGELGVVSDLSSTQNIDQGILTLLPQFDKVALYSVPVKVTDGYAILDIMETDVNAMKEEVSKVLRAANKVTVEANAYYLQENGFTVLEDRLKENIKTMNPDYIH